MRWVVVPAILACALAAGLLARGGGETAPGSDKFLTRALGEMRPGAPLIRRPAPGVRVRLDSSGFHVSRRNVGLGLSLAGGERGSWQRFDRGVSRPTAFGRETVLVESTGTEQFLTIEQRQGKRDWEWLLDAEGATPRLQPDGSILYLGAGRAPVLRTPPVAILDGRGRDVTPKGLRWSLRERGGHWRLGLTLDDSKLPVPYVIDPAADYPSPLYLSSTASTETGSWRLIGTAPSAANVTTNTTPAQNATGYYLWVPGAANTVAAAPPATPTGTGWVLDTAGGTGFPTGSWIFTVRTDIPEATLVAGSAVVNVGIWKGTIAGGVFVPTATILAPTDDPASQNVRTSVNPVTTNVTISVPRFSLATNERLFVEFRRKQVGGINSNNAARRRLTFEVNAGANNQIAHPTADDTAPANSLSITAATGAHYGSGTLYYKSDAAGSFRFSNALSDSGSGPYSTTYPPIGAVGWTHANETVTSGPPYVSSVYSWSAGPTNPLDQTIVGEDAALQVSNQTVSFVADTSAPTGMSASVSAGYYTSLSVPVTLANGSDTGSGVNASSGVVERDEAPLDNGDGSCDAFPGSWSTVTLSGGNDTTVESGKCYRYRYTISDNVGNQGAQAGTSATAKVDTSAPSDPSLTYGSLANVFVNGGVLYYRPSAASGQFQVTANGSSDAQSGVASHTFPAAASGWSVSGSGNARTYSHSGSPTDPSEPNNVFATNGAGIDSNSVSFTVTPDGTGPTVTAPTVTAGFYTSTSVAVTLNGGSDSGSGVAAGSSVVERDEAPLDNGDGSCDAFPGSWSTVTLSGGNDTSVQSGKCYRYREQLTDNLGNVGSSAASNTAKIDTSAPTGMSASVTAGYYTSLSVPVTLTNGSDTGSGVNASSGVIQRDEAPLDNGDGTCDTFPGSWSTVTLSGGNDTSVVSGKCYRYRYKISDNAGNEGTQVGTSATAKVDTSAPSDPSLTYGSLSNVVVNSGVLYYMPSAASGGFQVTANGSSDGQSGVTGYTFPAAASGWSVSGSGNARTYSHSGSPTDPSEPNDVFATNGAGLNSNSVSFTVTPDGTGPTVTAPTVTAGFYTSTSVAVTLNGGSDSGSGVAAGSSVVERDEAPLDNGDGSCDAFPGSWSTVTLSGGNDTSVQSGKCYRYREQLSDNLGNVGSSSASNTAKVDTSAPADPSLSYGSFSNAALNGGVVWYRPGAASGQFEVTAASSDGQSGVAAYTFPAAASGWSVSGSGAARTYSHAGSPSDPSEPNNVRATNGAGLNSNDVSFTVSPDSTAPSVSAPSVTAGFYTSTSVAVGLNGGSDSESGLAAGSSVVERDEAPLDNGDGTCDAFPGSWSTVTLSAGNDTSVQSGKCYRYRELLSDRVGNQGASAASNTAKVDTSAPADPSLSYGSFNNAALNGGVVWYRPGAASGQFEVTASSTDAQSGVTGYTFAAPAAGWSVSGTGNARTYSHSGSPTNPAEPNDVSAANGAGLVSNTTSFTVSPDSAAPSVTPPSVTAGFYTSASVAVGLNGGSDSESGLAAGSSVVERDEAPLDNGDGSCDAFPGSWSTVTLSGGNDTSVQSGKCYRYRELLSDRVGNQGASAASNTAKVDTSAPADPALSFGSFTNAAATGTTVWFRPGVAGGFRVSAASSDAQSGVSYGFPTLGSGWSGSQSGGDYDYSFTAAAADPSEPNNVRATNGAGLNSNDVSFTVSPDSTAPSVSAPSVTAGFYTSTSVAVGLNGGSDSESGPAAGSSVVERDEAPLDNGDGTCDAFPGSWSTVTLSGGNDTSVQSGKCYRYRELLSDRVGNQGASAASNTAKVDTTAPGAPTLAYGSFTAAAATGDTIYYRPSAGTGQFQVTATASDAQSGVASYTFAAPAAGWSVSGSGSARTYSHSGSPSDPADPNDVTVTNGAGLGSGASSFTVTPDASAPSGISATAGGYHAALSVAVTLDNGTDAGSGVDAASGIVERDEAPLDNGDGTCDTFPGSWSTVTLSGGNDTTVQTGKCYRYRYKLSDRVGNQATSAPSGTAKVDTTAPSVPTLSFGSLQAAAVAGSTVYYRPSAATSQFAVTASSSDGQSGVASYSFPAAASGWSVSGSGDTRTYSHSGSPTDPAEPNDVTAVNGAGAASGPAVYTVTPDATTPASSILCDGAACAGWHPATVSVTLSATDTGSGLAQIRYTTDGSDPTATTGTVYGGAFDVSSTTEIRYRGFDRVGNAEPVQSETIQFDTSGPTGPTLTLGETPADPDQHVAGTTLYYRPGSGRAGTFTVTAATSDAQSGIQKVTFPTIAGLTGGGDDFASPFEGVYDWSGAAGASGAQTVTARNNAALTSSAAFTVTPDSTAPTGHSVTLGGGSYYTALSVPLTLQNGSDGDSGIDAASGVVERQAATLSNDNCVGWAGVWTAVTLTGGADTTVVGDRCYRYRYTISDNVGNQAVPSAVSGIAKVDVAAPVTSDDAPAGWENDAVTVALSVTEAGSGAASTQYRVDGGAFQNGTSVVVPAPADHSNDGVHTVQYRSTDNAGNSESLRSVNVRIDTTLPTTSDDAPAGWRNSPVTVTLVPGDALSGIASTEYRVDGGAFQNGVSVAFPAPADGSNDGTHTLEYRSTDNAGNSEPLRSVNVRIDATLPTGSVTAPNEAQHVNGVVPVTAAAADGASGVSSVEFLVRPNGAGSFTTIATDTSAPYEASWDSSSAAEGNAELKVVVRDGATNAQTSAVRNVVVDNPPAPTLGDPGANVGGLITLTASSPADTTQVVFERSPEGAGAWTAIATDLTPPFAASFDTTGVGDGRYDFRAVATDAGGFGGTSPLRTSRVDNTRPSVSMSDPPSGALVGGPNVHLGALASDAGSGVASVRFEGRPAGGAAFAVIGTDASAPFDATWDTTALGGAYELQAVATDAAGNPQTSVAILVTVDSTAPSVTLGDVGSLVRGVVTLSASTQSTAVSQVVFKRKPSGGDSWADLETDTAAPWNAAFDTRSVADGLYDVRAQALDSFGTVLATHTRENIRVDNTAPALVSATPADGSTVTAATSVVLTANEAVAAVRGATLDGGVATPEIAGTQVTFATGTLPAGQHTLSGSLEDAAGNSTAFAVRFTVEAPPAPTALSLQLGKPRSTRRGKNQVFSIPVTVSTPARVQVTLLSPRGRRLRSTTVRLGAGRRVLSVTVPRASLPPGRYTLLVTATTPDGTQVVRRARVTITKAKRKAKPKAQSRRTSERQLTPSGGAVFDNDDAGAPPPAATPPLTTSRGGQVPPRVRPSQKPREQRSAPLATSANFVGEKKQKTFGLGLVIASMGGAIGFLIKVELGRLLGRPRRLGDAG